MDPQEGRADEDLRSLRHDGCGEGKEGEGHTMTLSRDSATELLREARALISDHIDDGDVWSVHHVKPLIARIDAHLAAPVGGNCIHDTGRP